MTTHACQFRNVRTFFVLLFFGMIVGECHHAHAQFARYLRSENKIEIDLGTSKIRLGDVERIYVQVEDGDSSGTYVITRSQIQPSGGTGLSAYILSLSAPGKMPSDLSSSPVQLDILVRPKSDQPDMTVIPLRVTEVGLQTTESVMRDELRLELASAKGKDDAELYLSGDVTFAARSKPNWVADAKYEREYSRSGFPLVFAPFFNLKYNSKVKNDTDKLSLGIRFSRGFAFASPDETLALDRPLNMFLASKKGALPNKPLFRRAREQREYFLYSGSAEFESDWDFRVNNFISSQELRYLLRPKFHYDDRGDLDRRIIFTPFGGVEIGANLKNPIVSGKRPIARIKVGGILTLTGAKPFGGHFGKELVWENIFTQRWFLADEYAFDKDDNGQLVQKGFGRHPRTHFTSSLQFKLNDYFGPAITYEWGESPPLFSQVRHKTKFSLVYSFKRKPLP